jgi:hypothetical protein
MFVKNVVSMIFRPQLARVCPCHHYSYTVVLLASVWHPFPPLQETLGKGGLQMVGLPLWTSSINLETKVQIHSVPKVRGR